ncbi:MAG: hypothetical protein K8F62_15945, partial [Pseudorhodoplanes sp.]|nr:hypothetical protein [Pseudorhodoplanes sp.]
HDDSENKSASAHNGNPPELDAGSPGHGASCTKKAAGKQKQRRRFPVAPVASVHKMNETTG